MARRDDGAGVAYATTGSGPALVVIPGWLSHLELDWAISQERAFYDALAAGCTLVRYDRPGCGLSAAGAGPPTMKSELDTVSAVTRAVGIDRFDVFGWSLGAAVAALWASEHPASVRRLVLYGGWVAGSAIADQESRRQVRELIANHWGLGSDLLTELFAPDADAGTRRILARYQRQASSPQQAVSLLELAYDLDVSAALADVRAPTLVLHRTQDRAAPVRQGGALADGIAGSTFVELDGRSHLPAFGDTQTLVACTRQFLGLPRRVRSAPRELTPRQLEVAALVAQGMTNRQIAQQLTITERSAESHVERIRLRLGFRSRAQVAAWYVTRRNG